MPIRPTEHRMNEYFARVEKEMKKLTGERNENHESKEQREKRREPHFMKCPKCGTDITAIDQMA